MFQKNKRGYMMNKKLMILGFGILVFSLKLDLINTIYLDERVSLPLGLLGLAFIIIGVMGKEG